MFVLLLFIIIWSLQFGAVFDNKSPVTQLDRFQGQSLEGLNYYLKNISNNQTFHCGLKTHINENP